MKGILLEIVAKVLWKVNVGVEMLASYDVYWQRQPSSYSESGSPAIPGALAELGLALPRTTACEAEKTYNLNCFCDSGNANIVVLNLKSCKPLSIAPRLSLSPKWPNNIRSIGKSVAEIQREHGKRVEEIGTRIYTNGFYAQFRLISRLFAQ